MSAKKADHVASKRRRDREVRAAVDVMFEALSHIQASLETSSEEKRRASYRKFKEALYDRFDHLIEQERAAMEEGIPEDETASQTEGGADGDDEETLEKLWPAVARNA